ncbi:DUF262 domain-containing protein [Leptospira montravelensis]|uniref:DUF262 domain-containing protein n=1 Tax=Leptospira montravelensis TaxID=2484961 RepID=UPI001082EF77|nr:DUF262 domain-containing protein [Leptospira montravelensis]TGK86204.1 DUF262 domain-containing protein [Leptospira montravelensis]
MQTELWTISKIFTEHLFRIPDYQRGYAWDEKQIKDFWNDIELLEDKKNHYTGVITLEEVSKSSVDSWIEDQWIIENKGYKPYFVVDGQQRLTTIIILLNSIIERIQENDTLNYSTKQEIRKKFIYDSKDSNISRSYIFGYEKDNPSYEYLITKIFNEKSTNHGLNEETIYTKNLMNAKLYFDTKLASLNLEEVQNVYQKVTQRFLFNLYVITADIDVFIAFETMNNRGKPLSYLEPMKNRLIYLSTLFDIDDNEKNILRKTVNEAWKSAYHYLGKVSKKGLPDNDFFAKHTFQYLCSSNDLSTESKEEEKKRGYASYRLEDYKDNLLENLFSTKRLHNSEDPDGSILTPGILKRYVEDIKSKVELYHTINNPSSSNLMSEEKIYLTKLLRLEKQHDLVSIILQSLYTSKDKSPKSTVLSDFESLIFLESMRITYDLNKILTELFISIEGKDNAVSILQSKISQLLLNIRSNVDFRELLLETTKSVDQYYTWKPLRYFLFEYETHLLEQSKTAREKLNWSEFSREHYYTDYSTIEHIYPKKAEFDC